MTSLKEGALAPDFSTQDDQGNTVSLSDFKGKKNVILYFYPKDDTPGCTIEACNFRDSYSNYQNQETQILGVSFDDEKSHQSFRKKFNLPFPLLIDSKKKIARAYGVGGLLYADRDTILIDKEGKIKKIFRKVDSKKHSVELLNLLGEK